MTTSLSRIEARDVTPEEVAFFEENGWVKLDQLIPEAAATSLLERLKEHMGAEGGHGEHPENKGQTVRWKVFAPLSVELETGVVRDNLFHSFSHSPSLGRVGKALLGSEARFWVDQALVKQPQGRDGSGATDWHIDIGDRDDSPFVPGHQVNIWIALAEVTPEHGAMRFVAPKDLTDDVKQLVAGRPVEETFADLEQRGILSPPLHLRPGDATVHGGGTFHAAPANLTDTPRWAYFVSLFPKGARYSGNPFWPMVGVENVQVGEEFPDHRFPVLV
jgi:hypothetical protein